MKPRQFQGFGATETPQKKRVAMGHAAPSPLPPRPLGGFCCPRPTQRPQPHSVHWGDASHGQDPPGTHGDAGWRSSSGAGLRPAAPSPFPPHLPLPSSLSQAAPCPFFIPSRHVSKATHCEGKKSPSSEIIARPLTQGSGAKPTSLFLLLLLLPSPTPAPPRAVMFGNRIREPRTLPTAGSRAAALPAGLFKPGERAESSPARRRGSGGTARA